MTHKVKCIYFDSLNKELRFEVRELPETTRYSDAPGFEKAMVMDRGRQIKRRRFDTMVHYRNPVFQAKDIPRYGLLWRHETMEEKSQEPFNRDDHRYTLICGDALIVSYDSTTKKNGEAAIPVDVTMTLEEAEWHVGEWCEGILERLPDFSCILNESFSERGYEILLRVNNEGEMYGMYAEDLTRPMRMLAPQIINFEYQFEEVTIITGFIDDPNKNTRVTILESGTSNLRTIAECTLAAHKIPKWIEARLQDFFFEKLVVARFNRKRSFQQSRLAQSSQ